MKSNSYLNYIVDKVSIISFSYLTHGAVSMC
jgi:hypothetical protein